MKEQKLMTVKQKISLKYTLYGSLLFLVGLLGLFPFTWATLFNWIILLVNSVALPAVLSRAKKETDDERSVRNLAEAKAKTLDAMQTVIFAYSIAAMALMQFRPSFMQTPVRLLAQSYFLLIGASYALTGFYFQKLEKC